MSNIKILRKKVRKLEVEFKKREILAIILFIGKLINTNNFHSSKSLNLININ